MKILRRLLVLFVLVYLLPIGVAAGLHLRDDVGADWWQADRSSAGQLPPAAAHAPALLRVFAAPTVRWRGIVAVHSWVVVKPEGTEDYTRYDVTAWGDPIRVNGFAADGRWFGRAPQVVFAADGEAAARMIPRIEAAVAAYPWRQRGDYRVWPGPNSNTFVAALLEAVPDAGAVLPPTAIGKDFPHDGRWLRATGSGTGLRLTLGGYAGVTIGWVEGIEVNILGGVAGIDLRRPAIKLPGLGRIGVQ
ncbi:DUF3750 domain-containing protein [Roseomonas sp. PWR1]|uniref:DUF3750 domain-containing protein n=1 Tax=Roseomonas nitratireducens TaxID=2820810 RepID=A0ABS4ASC5_9PROT|nr:DUF3750 domain-containing protein [Neoroseomonas nitratireducens]MBP0464254.1 DUF3750 domain-containing protein [Neoroseomonas nitratireducens]